MENFVSFVAEEFFWVFLGILLINLLQRRHHDTAEKKRFATLYLGIAMFFVYTSAQFIVMYEQPPYYFIAALAVIIGVLYRYREHTFPFRLRCRRTGKILNFDTILFRDSNILPEAEDEAGNEEQKTSEKD
ncbi:MAG: hypothetical protein ACQETQ_04630 [Spirochaetota bacterium]